MRTDRAILLVAWGNVSERAAVAGFDERTERDYNIYNPVNPINKYHPNNPFNPVNEYHPENPPNSVNKYNFVVLFGPLDEESGRRTGVW